MEITFNLPHVQTSEPSNREERDVLRALTITLQNLQRYTHWTKHNKPELVHIPGTPYWSFHVPNVFYPGANPRNNAAALRILMAGLTEIDRLWMREHPDTVPLYESGVFYKRTNLWESIPALYARGFGDCKSLTAAYVAQSATPAQPVYRFNPRSDKGNDYHILVQGIHGYEDPSKVLGMGRDENRHF